MQDYKAVTFKCSVDTDELFVIVYEHVLEFVILIDADLYWAASSINTGMLKYIDLANESGNNDLIKRIDFLLEERVNEKLKKLEQYFSIHFSKKE